MGKKCLLIPFLFAFLNVGAIEVSVDETIEFVSAIARLSGYEEYIDNTNQEYVSRLDSILSNFKSHPAVKYLRQIRGSQSIGYDAIATLAVHSEIRDGHFTYIDGAEISDMDDRWHKGQAQEIADLLDDLYQKCNFHDFYIYNQPFYDKVIANVSPLLESADVKWLENLYGKPLMNSRVVASLLNNGNYGSTKRINGKADEAVIIIGCYDRDENKIPVYRGLETLIVHECSHPICNPIIDANYDKFNRNVSLAAELMADELRSQAYSTPETMMYETLVRGAVLLWSKKHEDMDSTMVDKAIKANMQRGFFFMPEVIAAYEKNQGNPIDSIGPYIVKAINAVDVSARYTEIMTNSPRIIGCSLEEGANNVKPSDEFEISFYFDQPIGNSFGMAYLDNREDILPNLANVKERLKRDDSHMILTIKIIAQPGKEYGFVLPGAFFTGKKGYRGHGEVRVHFYTSNQ